MNNTKINNTQIESHSYYSPDIFADIPSVHNQYILPSKRFANFNPNDPSYMAYIICIGIDANFSHVDSFKDLVSLFIHNNLYFDYFKFRVQNHYRNSMMNGFEIQNNVNDTFTLPDSLISDLLPILDDLFYSVPVDARWFYVTTISHRMEVIFW